MACKNCLQGDSRRSHSVGSPDAANASLYDSPGKMVFIAVAECSPACLTAVPSVPRAMPGRHSRWAASPLL